MSADNWNYDISAAPTDGSAIWAACGDGRVYRTHWLPADGPRRPVGRWIMLGSKEVPLAWQPYIVPRHPFAAAEG